MKNIFLSSILLLLLSFVSCKTVQSVIDNGTVKKTTDARLRSNLLDHQLSYNKFYSKKASVKIEGLDKTRNFKCSYVSVKDSILILSLMPSVGIEIARLKLTPDSVFLIDRVSKSVSIGDFKSLSKKFNVDVDFATLQSILTNNVFVYPSNNDLKAALKKYKHDEKEFYYTFSSSKEGRGDRLTERQKNDFILHDMQILPDIYRIKQHIVSDFSRNQTLTVLYSNFIDYDGYVFPKETTFDVVKGNSHVVINITTKNIEINDGGSLHFKIPNSYEVSNF